MALARVCSALFSYHFSFLAVSLALLGMGLGGLSISRRSDEGWGWVPSCCIGFALGVVVFTLAAFLVPLHAEMSLAGVLPLVGLALLGTIPFVFGGVAICSFLRVFRQRVGTVYAADLAGGALACLTINPLLNGLGPVTCIFLAGAVTAAVGLWVARGTPQKVPAGVMMLLMLALTAIQSLTGAVRMDSITIGGKRQRVSFDVWNSLSRISVIEYPQTAQFIIDAGADTWINSPKMNSYYPSEMGYCMRPGGRFAVIGPGAGPDVVMGLAHHPASFDLVEINPTMIHLVQNQFDELSGHLYKRPGMTVHIGDGRSFMGRTRQQFDVLVISLVDTYASVSGGAHALTENFLYTAEALHSYLERVQPDGVVCVSRWWPEAPRLVGMARSALEMRGVGHPQQHMVGFLSRGQIFTLLISSKPWTPVELAFLKQHLTENDYPMAEVLSPASDPEKEALAAFASRPLAPLQEVCPLDVSPSFDDRPFFLSYYKHPSLRRPGPAGELIVPGPKPVKLGELGLEQLGAQSNVVLALAFPTLLGGLASLSVLFYRGGSKDRVAPAHWTCFALLGVGFMLFEISVSQKLVLLLGHPAYAISIVLFSFLVFGSLGSFLSEQVRAENLARMQAVCGVLVAAVGLLGNLLYPYYVELFLHGEQWLRTLAAMLWIAPMAVCIGMPFPMTLRRTPERWTAHAWAVNGGASVAGSGLAVTLSLLFGFTATTYLACACYLLLAVIAVRGLKTES